MNMAETTLLIEVKVLLLLGKPLSAGEQYHRIVHSAPQIREKLYLCTKTTTLERIDNKILQKEITGVLGELESLKPQVEREIAKVNVEHILKEQYQLNNQRKAQDDSQASSSRQSPRSRMRSLRPDSKQESRLSLTLSIPLGTPGTVPSAPPIENLVISEDTPMPSGVDESSFVDSSSSTTENLLKRHDEESSSTTASSSCIICYEAPIEGACVPCGHMAGCMSCLNEIKAKSWGCPVCRTKIELVLRLFAV